MKQPSDTYTQELNLEPRQQSDGERAAWLADKLENGTTDLIELTSAIDLLRKYSELERKREYARTHTYGSWGED